MRKSVILFLVYFMLAVFAANAQTDFQLSGGDSYHEITLKTVVVGDIGIQAQYTNLHGLDNGNIAMTFLGKITGRLEFSSYAGIDYFKKFTYGANLDYEVFNNVFVSAGTNNYTMWTAGLKLRVSAIKNKCKCNWRRQ